MTAPTDVLIFGGHGQVGEALVATASLENRDPERIVQLGRDQADLTRPDTLVAVLDRYRPRAAINCAVFQPVDLCESEPGAAFAVNATGAGHLATACRRAGVRLVHLSTDYVFGGPLRRPYRETDLPAPQNLYAASKLAGEHLVLAASEVNMVIRTSSVYGKARAGSGTIPFVERMLERARTGQETRVVTDQVVSPTSAEDLARAIWRLLGYGGTGLFHAAGRGEGTWFEVAKIVFKAAAAIEHLKPTTAAEFAAPARRAAYTSLDNVRLRKLGLDDLPPWRESLATYLAQRHPDLPRLG